MSELKKELLVPKITKKRVIGTILLAGFLITAFAFSTYFINLAFGTQRELPSEELAEAEEEDPEEVNLYEFDIEDLFEFLDLIDPADLQDLLDDLELTDEQVEQLLEDILENMSDGDIDDIDLVALGIALIFLLYSDQEVFRVYDYDPGTFNERDDILWKYECFDEFQGNEWLCNSPASWFNFYPYEDYEDYYLDSLDMIKIKMPMSPMEGRNSFVIPSLFPNPYIMEDSVNASTVEEDSEIYIYKTDFNSTILSVAFDSSDEVDLNYELFGLELPSPDDINDMAIEAKYTPSEIESTYLQLPPSIEDYLDPDINPNFVDHYNNLDGQIDQDNENAFIVANKIRNYLQDNFIPSYFTGFQAYIDDPPDDGEDVVEWFCEKEEGLSSEFASAFCAFTRAFGVASRFVDGYNSIGIEEFDDNGENAYSIKYKNIYHWAEIYVPIDIDGDGMWVQMDVMYDRYGGVPPFSSFSINIESNYTIPISRGSIQNINITATLRSVLASVDNKEIDFYDLTMDQPLPSKLTDENGNASILVNIDNSQVVGPHYIRASYMSAENFTNYVITGPIEVTLNSVSPEKVNKTEDPMTIVSGNVFDPVANRGVGGATLNFTLLQKGTNNHIYNPFTDPLIDTDYNGNFNDILTVDIFCPRGDYDIRADFNGSWYEIPTAPMSNSSNRLDFNVTEELFYALQFFINGTPTDCPNPPNPSNLIYAKRGDELNLTVIVIDEISQTLAEGVEVEFYDYSNNDVYLTSEFSDPNGEASMILNPWINEKAGPNLLYAKVGNVMNYSYYILNESIQFDVLSGPNPREINSTDSTGNDEITFDIICRLLDEQNNPINFSQIELKMFSGISDVSYYLNPQFPIFNDVNSINMFYINNVGVQPDTPAGNYTLRLYFYGNINYNNDPNPNLLYKPNFNIADLSNYTILSYELKVFNPEEISISILVNGSSTLSYYDNNNPPEIFNPGEKINFTVYVNQSGSYLVGYTVNLYDVYSDNLLDSHLFVVSDYGNFSFEIDANSLDAGLRQIKVSVSNFLASNNTFVIINKTFSIDASSSNNIIIRGGQFFNISGTVYDSSSLIALRRLRVKILLLNRIYDNVTDYYLNYVGSQIILINDDGTYRFDMNTIDLSCPQNDYYIRIDFNGSYYNLGSPGIIPGVDLTINNIINVSSSLLRLNITANDTINGYYYTKYFNDRWVQTDILYVVGTLVWDNSTIMTGMNITVIVKNDLDEVFNITTDITDINGEFNVSIIVGDWTGDIQVWVEFYPLDENNFGIPEGYYVEFIQQELYRNANP